MKVDFCMNGETMPDQLRDWPMVPRIGDEVLLRTPRINGVGGSIRTVVIYVILDDYSGELMATIHVATPAERPKSNLPGVVWVPLSTAPAMDKPLATRSSVSAPPG